MLERFSLSRALIALDHQDEEEQRRQVAALVSGYLAMSLKDNMVLAVTKGVTWLRSPTMWAAWHQKAVNLSVALGERIALVTL